ncbi:MAG TPA: radical SAM family heme chaperone HemW [Pseudomonadales bacterium]|nr:radical SAM family heme chaperone HemW [Pseudomonadales bacterium]
MTLPLALYVHVPWCIRKCPYCDFNSHALQGEIPANDYIEALVRDLEADLATFEEQREIVSVFFGGGTPSLLPAAAIGNFIARARRAIAFSPHAEITLEANPGTVREGAVDFSGLLKSGVNRLSLGVQSFDDAHLGALGRIHSAGEAMRAFELARSEGFDNINLDLMHGLPGQLPENARADLRAAIDLRPEHISWYQLTIEPNTVFHKRPPALPDEDILDEIETTGFEMLADAGFHRYEISAFARQGRMARHNLNYWQFGDYLGVGAGAHGKITRQGKVLRTAKTRMPEDYLRHCGRRIEPVPAGELATEYLMSALRLTSPFSLSTFERRTGLPATQLQPFLARAVDKGLLAVSGSEVGTTPLGLKFLNSLLALAMDESVIATSSD